MAVYFTGNGNPVAVKRRQHRFPRRLLRWLAVITVSSVVVQICSGTVYGPLLSSPLWMVPTEKMRSSATRQPFCKRSFGIVRGDSQLSTACANCARATRLRGFRPTGFTLEPFFAFSTARKKRKVLDGPVVQGVGYAPAKSQLRKLLLCETPPSAKFLCASIFSARPGTETVPSRTDPEKKGKTPKWLPAFSVCS
jgi:hypothetical protein